MGEKGKALVEREGMEALSPIVFPHFPGLTDEERRIVAAANRAQWSQSKLAVSEQQLQAASGPAASEGSRIAMEKRSERHELNLTIAAVPSSEERSGSPNGSGSKERPGRVSERQLSVGTQD